MKSRQEIQMELCAPDAVRESAEGLEFNVREFFEAQAKGNAKDMRWHAHHAKEALGGLMIAAANGVFDCPEMDGPTPRNRMEPGDASRPD